MSSTAFGALAKRIRTRRGLTMRDAGTLSGIDHAYIARLESGAKTSPSPEIVDRLCNALRPTKSEKRELLALAKYGLLRRDEIELMARAHGGTVTWDDALEAKEPGHE